MPRERPEWETAYRDKEAESLSWFENRPDVSLDLIRLTGLSRDAVVVDVGAGSSPVLICLAREGWGNLTAVDLSPSALAGLKAQLPASTKITTIAADICDWQPKHRFDLWHDRAALHFLTDRDDRLAYVGTLKAALKPGGFAVFGAFAPDGPDTCFGQRIQRYDAQELSALLGDEFRLVEERRHTHATPRGTEQRYFYALMQRAG
ncbi:class I SAM-dependent methyltransferase [Thalassovita sp.]|uniref:class I SAM-dependent methyltransferase n=1 Tax=Thalassovita sp. TaxID=1979401 RepID=UPI0029DE7662|nr:class I SAM-dependent methyltransferase [Thalassovita sp.]